MSSLVQDTDPTLFSKSKSNMRVHTLISRNVSTCQTFTSPLSQALTTWVSFSLAAQTIPLCLKVFRHFPLSISHTIKNRKKPLISVRSLHQRMMHNIFSSLLCFSCVWLHFVLVFVPLLTHSCLTSLGSVYIYGQQLSFKGSDSV